MVRFLQLQHRRTERNTGGGRFEPVDELTTPTGSWLTWDEATECETSFGPLAFDDPARSWSLSLAAAPATDVESVEGGRLVRTRREVSATLTVSVEPDGALHRVSVRVANTGAPAADKDDAIARSLIGTHVIAEAVGGEFVSLLEPPPPAADAVSRCSQHRCFPVLAGPPGAAGSAADLADHPLRPPRGRRTERDRALRLHRDRRDPDPAGDDDDRPGEGAGPGHRSAGRADHRPL